MNQRDIAMLQEAQQAHRKAVQAILGPNMGLRQSEPMRVRGPRRRYPEADRRLRQMQRRLKSLAQAADLAGQPGLGALAELALKEAEEEQ